LSVRLCHHFPTADERTQYIEEVLRVSRKWVILTYLDTDSFHHFVRSASRRLEGKPVKWSMSNEEVADVASSQGFEVMDSTLLSPMFSGQRYAVLMRTQSPGTASASKSEGATTECTGTNRMKAARDAVCAWAHRWQTLLLMPLLIFCLFSSVGDVERDRVVLPIGLALFFAGFGLRVWSQLHQRHRFRTHMAFTATGPFAWVRNPIQLGNTAIVVGLCVFSEVVYFAPVVAIWAILVYTLAGRHEEKRLLKNCGQKYRDYMARVPRWIPRVPAKRSKADIRPYCAMSLRGEQYTLLMLLPFAILELFAS
jgi:protein-S-isoprenylcysteine O-methyltransferase Ste14